MLKGIPEEYAGLVKEEDATSELTERKRDEKLEDSQTKAFYHSALFPKTVRTGRVGARPERKRVK